MLRHSTTHEDPAIDEITFLIPREHGIIFTVGFKAGRQVYCFAKDGVIHTPIADRFLNGITRQTVISLAKDMGITVEERRIKPEELEGFEEIFLTGSAAEITPVGSIDDMKFTPGEITAKLHDAYTALTHGE